jgi:EAL and modified HD-GYP domain-containing signal transduction protein
MILHRVPFLFPGETVGISLIEDIDQARTTPNILEMMKTAGYLVMIDDRLFNEGDIALVKLADIIGVDFRSQGIRKRFSIDENDPLKPRFLAKSVETPSDFDFAINLGYRYFQGEFFCTPNIVSIRNIPSYKINFMRILQEIHKPSVRFDQVEEILKRDISITYKLLRFVNSASFGLKTTVQSIRQALTYLGEVEVRKWLSMIILTGIGTDKPHELVVHTLVRARLCESIAEALHRQEKIPNYFLVGMLSNIDAFLDRPMDEIINDLPLDDEIKSALLGKSNLYRDVLDLVLDYETANWMNVSRDADKLNLDMTQIGNMYVDAVEWGKLL